MYKEHLKLQPTKGGQGLFTTVAIPAKTPILEVRGPVMLEKNLPDPNHPALLQIGPDTFIGASGDLDDFINHSCNPNCYMHITGNRAILFSLYVIPVGAELTFDYSSTATDSLEKWKMNCLCGHFTCRKVISGFQHLDESVKQSLKDKGSVPLYILYPNMFPKSW
jgi:SET domain-containing protein